MNFVSIPDGYTSEKIFISNYLGGGKWYLKKISGI